MAVGDVVKVGMGSVETSSENIPVYDLAVDNQGRIMFDQNNAAMPKVVGGVKGGSSGKINGSSVRVMRSSLVGGNVGASMGVEFVQMYPVFLDYYQKVGWFPQEHTRVVGSYQQH